MSIIKSFANRVIGTVELVSSDRIEVLLDPEAPQVTALNTGSPSGFPRINGYVLIPNESGAMVGLISSVRIERLPYPKRKGTQQDFGLVDLPFPARLMILTPLGTLVAHQRGDVNSQGNELKLKVTSGIDVFPSVGDPVLLPTPDQLKAIVEGESAATSGCILLGCCPTAGRAQVFVDPDKLFGRHLAILGNTGAGKSCSVAGLVRWSIEAAQKTSNRVMKNEFDNSKKDLRPNARFIILDPNGEYSEAFKDLGVRLFQVEPKDEANQLKVPAWLWNGEEWTEFVHAAPGVQQPILLSALRLLRSNLGSPNTFTTKLRSSIKRYRNRLRLLINEGYHMTSGRREGVAIYLLNAKNDFESHANNPECPSELKQMLEDISYKAEFIENSSRGQPKGANNYWHNDFPEEGDNGLNTLLSALDNAAITIGLEEGGDYDEDTPRYFDLKGLPDYIEAIAAGQSGRDIAQFVDTLNLRIRSLFKNTRLASVIQPNDSASITLEDWLRDYIGADQASNGAIAIVDLSLVPSMVIHIVVCVLARMIFEAVQRYRHETGCVLPTILVLEEAHTFIHREISGDSGTPVAQACSRVFERIAREGRKFGLGLVLASQRPSEISPTVLSQCNTFLLHRIVNDRDQELVKRLVPDGFGTLLRELPNLPTRRAILLGWAAPAPVLVEIREVEPKIRPHSPDPPFWDVWIGKKACPIDWKKIAKVWQGGCGDIKNINDEVRCDGDGEDRDCNRESR